jgi:hypothetical protein
MKKTLDFINNNNNNNYNQNLKLDSTIIYTKPINKLRINSKETYHLNSKRKY